VGVAHEHLAAVLEILENPDPAAIPGGKKLAAVVVAEHVAGESLHQRLKSGPVEASEAVETFQRLARAVFAIHGAGGAHGAISPRSIVVAPSGRLAPVLTQLVAPTSGAYCAPERLQGRGPSAPDDVWALHAALFTSLACSPPFKGETKDQLLLSIAGGRQQKLESLGVREPELSEILEAGLTPDLARRRSGIEELMARLDAWLSAHTQGEWEDDEATLVASQRDYAEALRSSEGAKPAPVPSMPPVSLEEGSEPPEPEPPEPEPPEPEPPPPAPEPEPPPPMERNPFDDEDDATTVMGMPPIEDIRAALAREDPPEPEPAAFPPPVAAPAIPPPPPPMSPENEPPPIPSAANLAPPPAASASAALPAGVAAYPPLVSYPPPAMSQPTPPVLAADDDDIKIRNPIRGPLIVIGAIVVLVAIAIGVAMYLNHRAAAAGSLTSDLGSARLPAAELSVPHPVQSVTAVAALSAPPAPAPPVNRGQCVAHQFESGTLQGDEGYDFLCDDADFRGISSQLRRRLVVAGAGKVTPGMREWSTFGWFELAATAVIRARCCDATTPAVKLPKTGGACPQLTEVLANVARQPVAPADVPKRAEAFSDAVLCLFTKGIPRPYSYSARPTGHARKIFEGFLSRAAQHG
jgi:serine/threonine protein kinase